MNPNQILEKNKKQISVWIWPLIATVVLAVATIIVYYPSLNYEFQFDDIYNIRKFFDLRHKTVKDFLFTGTRWISYTLNSYHYKIAEYQPYIYRQSNILFHIVTGILVFFVTLLGVSNLKNRLLAQKALPLAFFTSLIFLLHPVQTQTVSYIIQGQLEGLAQLFMMMILLTYIFYVHAQSVITKIVLLALLTVLGILSCGTKEIAVLSPLMLALFDWFFISQGSFTEIKKRMLFFIGYTFLIVYNYATYLNVPFIKNSLLGKGTVGNNIGNILTENPKDIISSYTYCISQFKVILHYIGIFFWPFNISVDYDWKITPDLFSFECLVPLIILLSILTETGYLLYKNKISLFAFSLLWFFIGLAPRTTIIPSTELVADYKTYFSSFGMAFLLALVLIYGYQWIIKKIHLKEKTFTSYFASIFLIGILGYGTYDRNKVWKSSEAFWMNIIQNSPQKARAYNNYGVAIAEQKRHEEAIPFFRKAVKLDPQYPDPWSNGSVCYSCLGKTDLAINLLEQAIRINPSYPEFYNNLASYQLQKKNYAEVKKLAEHAIKLRPHYGKAYFNWGQALYQEGDKEKAHEKIKYSCLNADYDVPETFKTYAELSVELKKYEDALIGFSTLYKINPQDKDALFNTANAYFFLNDHEKAQQIYTQLIAENPTEYRSWLNLAETYIKKNELQKAAECYEKAQPLTPQFPDIPRRLANCNRLLAESVRG